MGHEQCTFITETLTGPSLRIWVDYSESSKSPQICLYCARQITETQKAVSSQGAHLHGMLWSKRL